jgi:hypothetical protein
VAVPGLLAIGLVFYLACAWHPRQKAGRSPIAALALGDGGGRDHQCRPAQPVQPGVQNSVSTTTGG